MAPLGKPVVFTNHALGRIEERGTRQEDVHEAIRVGQCNPAQRGLLEFRLNLEFKREWDGRYYSVQQVVPIVAEERDRWVVVTVYVFYFQGGKRDENLL